MKYRRDPVILLSPKYGVNPTIAVCFFCLRDKEQILLLGKINGRDGERDVQAPKRAIYDNEPCDLCKEDMKTGVVLLVCKANDRDTRSGSAVISEEAFERIFEMPIPDNRAAYIDNALFQSLIVDAGEIDADKEVD
jgi:hypothetical protein